MANNTPKPTYNVLKVFNNLSGQWIKLAGGDGDVSAVASWDAARGRLAIVLVNFRDRYALRRHARVEIGQLPPSLAGGQWREWLVDATHANVWHDQGQAELAQTQTGPLSHTRFTFDRTLAPNSVTLLELLAKKAAAN